MQLLAELYEEFYETNVTNRVCEQKLDVKGSIFDLDLKATVSQNLIVPSHHQIQPCGQSELLL